MNKSSLTPSIRKGDWRRLMLVLFFGFFAFSDAVPQDVGSMNKRIVEIQKAGRDITNPYLVTLTSDRMVNFRSYFRTGYWQKQSHLLSQEEYDRVVALLRGKRFRTLAATPLDPVLYLGGVLAQITFFRDDVSEILQVDDRNDSHMELFRELTTLLRVESLRCPFMVERDGKVQDLCEVEKELQRQLEERNRK